MGVSVNAKINGFDTASLVNGQRSLANQFLISSYPCVPRRRSNLVNQTVVAPDGSSIVYTVPYAHYQYANQFVNYTTPGTGPYWDKQVKANFMPALKKAFIEGAKI